MHIASGTREASRVNTPINRSAAFPYRTGDAPDGRTRAGAPAGLAFPLPDDPEILRPRGDAQTGLPVVIHRTAHRAENRPPYRGRPARSLRLPSATSSCRGALIIESRLTNVAFGRLYIGHADGTHGICRCYTDVDGTLVLDLRLSPTGTCQVVRDVFIVGIGIQSVRVEPTTAADCSRAKFAVRAAPPPMPILIGRTCNSAFGGVRTHRARRTRFVTQLGQTTIPFVNVLNGCANRRARALFGAYFGHQKSQEFELGIVAGVRQAPARAPSIRGPSIGASRRGMGEAGHDGHPHNFLLSKLRRYMDLFGITHRWLSPGWPRKPITNGTRASARVAPGRRSTSNTILKLFHGQ